MNSEIKTIFRRKNILGISILLTTVFAAGVFFVVYPDISPQSGSEYIIELREDGFYPQEITIKKGETITFATISHKKFWPASNLHPTHGIYPEFDPKEPIEPDESWSFEFKKIGQWTYHDHLFPLYRGTITVLGTEETRNPKPGKDIESTCSEFKLGQQTKCWEDVIEATLKNKGVDAAFDVVASIYDTHPDCHGYVHLIGEEAYRLFSQGNEIALTSKTAYCGYGFYHGFMETLLLSSGDMAEARSFCAYVDRQLSAKRSGAANACYHGIGHGTVDGGDPRAWGSIEAMLAPGLEVCRKVSETEFQEYLCATGAFNAIEILSLNRRYEISHLNNDPFSICHTQLPLHKEPCYTNMIPAVLRLTNDDVSEAARYVERTIQRAKDPTIDNYTVREMVILSLSYEFIRLHLAKDDHVEKGVALCRSFPEHSRLACFEGLSGGYMKYGKPDEEYKKALAFCKNSLLLEDEQNACYKHLLSRLHNWYSQEQSRQICETVKDVYKDRWCRYL